MDQMDTEIGAGKFEMFAGVTGPVIGIKSDRFTMGSDGGHEFGHHDFCALAGKKTGMDDVSCGIVHDCMQIGFSFIAFLPDFGTMKKVSHPQLTEKLIFKRSCGDMDGQVWIPMQIGCLREPVKGRPGRGFHIPQILPDQLAQHPGQGPSGMFAPQLKQPV
jgi:hypothetical protein